MGAKQEAVVRAFLECTEGASQDVEGLIGLMTEDVVWQINVPT